MKNPCIYFDYAATTPLDERVFERMAPYMTDPDFQGNPSSLHSLGRTAHNVLEEARMRIAQTLGVESDEIIFTGSGTESDNLAIIGIARAHKEKGKHIIVSCIEHKAIMESAHILEHEGFSVSYAPVDSAGVVDTKELLSLVRPDTIMISVMLINNEVGSIQPIREIADGIRAMRNGGEFPLLHTDACQAASVLSISPHILGADLMTLNGGKIYGPKGVGCLWLRRGIRISPLVIGGSQELGRRSGTENISLAVGFAHALELAHNNVDYEHKRLAGLNTMLRNGISTIEGTHFNSTSTSSPSIVNVSFAGTEGESLLLDLDAHGICCSTGSACAASDLKPSYVLISMGIPEELAHASLRFSLGRHTTVEDVAHLIDVLPLSVARIRSICPSTKP